MKLKLCGIRRNEDIRFINEFTPTYIGFVFADSRRKVTPKQAAALIQQLEKPVRTVGVFVNMPVCELLKTLQTAPLDVIQLHGDEDVAYIRNLKRHIGDMEIWKAVRVQTPQDILSATRLPVDKLLFDTFSASQYGGTGKTADWELIAHTPVPIPYFLAGGLHMGNLAEAVSKTAPYGVDLSGGIETEGNKDREKIRQVITLVKEMMIDE